MEVSTTLGSLMSAAEHDVYDQELQEMSTLSNDAEGGVSGSTNLLQSAKITTVIVATNNTSVNTLKKKKKKNMKVNFKEGSDIIAGYLEPPDPWRNVEDWSAGELETTYKRACNKHNIKPLPCILQQLKIFNNIKDRYEQLNLKGEKLDLRHCECLEEIFRRVQFRTVNIEGTHLDDESAVALFDMVEHYESACKVDISFNKNIGMRGWQACARAIKRTPCLTYLDARNCDLNDRTIPFICRSLRMGCHLTTLHLENASIAGRSLMILVAALKVNETLKELFLGDNKLMPTDAVQLGQLLNCNHHLSLLDLRNNPIQDTGLGHISDGLHKQNLGTGLNTLVLWNTQVTFQGMAPLSPALVTTTSLHTLNLAHNNINNEGIFRLKDALLSNKSLLRLGLQSSKLSCEAAIALAEVIADSRHLVRVDLRENDIRTAGLMALSLALKVNEVVTKLDLDKDIKKDSSMKDYAEQQHRLQQDIANCLTRNQSNATVRETEQRNAEAERLSKLKQQEQARIVAVDENVNPPTHRPDSLSTGSRQESLDSPGIVPGQLYPEEVVPVVPLVLPMSLSLDVRQNTVSPDFILSPQYQKMENVGQLLPVAGYDFESRGVNLLPATEETPNESVSDVTRDGEGKSATNHGSYLPMKNDPHRMDGDKFCDFEVKDILQEIVDLTVQYDGGLSANYRQQIQRFSNSSDVYVDPVNSTSSVVPKDYTDTVSSRIDKTNCDNIVNYSGHDAVPCDSNTHSNTHCLVEKYVIPDEKSTKYSVETFKLPHNTANIPVSMNGDHNHVNPKVTLDYSKSRPDSSYPIFDIKVPNMDFTGMSNAVHKSPSSLNGVNPDLIKAFDDLNISSSLQEDGTGEESSAPDEFERELDAMLASVRNGWSPSLSMVPNKSPDQILQEAMANGDK